MSDVYPPAFRERLFGAHIRRRAEQHAHLVIIAGDVIVGEWLTLGDPPLAGSNAFGEPEVQHLTEPSGRNP